jgi:amidase
VAGRELTDADIEPGNLLLGEIGRSISAPRYLASVAWLQQFQRRMARWWDGSGDGFNLLVTPVIAKVPPPIGWLTGSNIREVMQFTAQLNMTGQPAISLPLHRTADGLPVGVQLVAGFGREDVLLRVAAQLEQAAPWADRHPVTA